MNLQDCYDAEDFLAVEEPLEIQLKAGEAVRSLTVTMRTPGNDVELAVGFLFTEGVLKRQVQIKDYQQSENKILIEWQDGESPLLQNVDRNFYTTSSCGVCGKTSIDAIRAISSFDIRQNQFFIETGIIQNLDKQLSQQQALFSKTGGLHASALFDADGSFISVREDVGRHNALDKLIGHNFLNHQLPLSNKILLLSGRASFELVQKAWMAGIPIVVSIGAPSSLAVSLAKEAGITLIGFLRYEQFNIYCGYERVAAYALV